MLHKPVDARRHGIEIVHQDLALCNNLTAAANVFLGRELRTGPWPFQVLDYASMYRRAGEIFKELKSETRPRDLVKKMSGGQRQAVAIARTRLSEAKIVLMDEPTAAISVRQVAEVLNLIRQLRDQGIAVVLISHRMPDVFDVADRIIVLRRGRKVADKADREELARRGHRPHHRRHRAGSSVSAGHGRETDGIDNGNHHPRPDDRAQAAKLDFRRARQPDLLGLHRRDRGLRLSVVRHRRLRHDEEPLQHHPQRHLRRHHRARHDAGHHHRRHRPLGRLGALPVLHGARR